MPFGLWIDTPNFASMPLPSVTKFILGAIGVFALSPSLRARELHAQVIPIEWSLRIAPPTARVGQQFTALVRAQIPYSWHLYSTTQPSGGPIATKFVVSAGNFALHGKVGAREPQRAFDAIAGLNTETYSDSVTFRVPVKASRAGKQTLELKVRYQSCTDRFCTPERSEVLRTTVSITPPAANK